VKSTEELVRISPFGFHLMKDRECALAGGNDFQGLVIPWSRGSTRNSYWEGESTPDGTRGEVKGRKPVENGVPKFSSSFIRGESTVEGRESGCHPHVTDIEDVASYRYIESDASEQDGNLCTEKVREVGKIVRSERCRPLS
jgi:hypothetical protein